MRLIDTMSVQTCCARQHMPEIYNHYGYKFMRCRSLCRLRHCGKAAASQAL